MSEMQSHPAYVGWIEHMPESKATGHHCVRFDSKRAMLTVDQDGYRTTCVCECGEVIVKGDEELAESQLKADAAYGSHVRSVIAADRLSTRIFGRIGQ